MKDNKLRQKRLVYYADDLQKIDKLMEEFLKLSNAKCIFLIDKEGHMISNRGLVQQINAETLSALVAGSFAATKEMARLLGESEFSVMFHQGSRDHIHIAIIGDRAISATIFDEKTTVGMINLYSKELSVKLEKIFDIAIRRVHQEQAVEADYSESVKDKLNDLFKE